MNQHSPTWLTKSSFGLLLLIGWGIGGGLTSCSVLPRPKGILLEMVDPSGSPYLGYQLKVSVIDSLHQGDSLIFFQTSLGYQEGSSRIFLPDCRVGYYRVVAQCERTQTTSHRVIRYVGKLSTFAIVIPQRQYWHEP